MKLYLYGTSFCHLCERAEAVLHSVGVTAEQIDIAEDDDLLERYGTRIPVVKRIDSGSELGWPFDEAELRRFIR